MKEETEKKHGRSKQIYNEINDQFWEWYRWCRVSHVLVSGPMLQEEALAMAMELRMKDFKPLNDWLEKWKNKHNVAQKNVAGEEGNVSETTVDSWLERVRELTKDYVAQHIWNMDESGAFWKSLPDRSLTEKKKRCRGGNKSKQQVTVAFFINAAGEEKLVIIRKSKKLGCFKKLQHSSKPAGCRYVANTKSWMKSYLLIFIVQS